MPKFTVDGFEIEIPQGRAELHARDGAAWPIQDFLGHFRPGIKWRIAEQKGTEPGYAEATE